MTKDLNRHTSKEDIQMANKVMKICSTYMSLKKCKLKQWDTTTHLLDWPKSRTLTTLKILERIWSNRKSNSLLVEMQNGLATVKDSLVVSYKTKHTLAILSNVALLGIYPKELKIYTYILCMCMNLGYIGTPCTFHSI